MRQDQPQNQTEGVIAGRQLVLGTIRMEGIPHVLYGYTGRKITPASGIGQIMKVGKNLHHARGISQ